MTQLESLPATEARRVICSLVSPKPGPTLIAVGGIHGNEPAGIEAAQTVGRLLDHAGGLARGRFVALRGNLAALSVDPENPLNNPRYLAQDLNRLFSCQPCPEPGRGNASQTELQTELPRGHADQTEHPNPDRYERDRLREAIDDAAREATGPIVLLDFHTTSSDSPPFIAVEDSLPARRFAQRLLLPLVLGVEEELTGLLMDDATRRISAVALTVEGGRHENPRAAHTLESVLWIALENLGLIGRGAKTSLGKSPSRSARAASGPHAGRTYDTRHREPVSTLPYLPAAGLGPFSPVRAGKSVIAHQAGRPLHAAESGLLFMPNLQRDIRPGDDAYFVVRRVGRIWLGLSAVLRSRPWLHRALPSILPGVRRRPGHDHELLVDPEIAVVLRREIFHLLGYRLVRSDHQPGLPRITRLRRASRLACHALLAVVQNLLRRGSTDTDAREHESDWIVRRHRLDTEPPSFS